VSNPESFNFTLNGVQLDYSPLYVEIMIDLREIRADRVTLLLNVEDMVMMIEKCEVELCHLVRHFKVLLKNANSIDKGIDDLLDPPAQLPI